MAVISPENIPDEVRATKQWAMWKKGTRDGKPAKVPFQPDGKAAKSNDASTWSTFGAVLSTFQDIGGFDGVCWMMPVKPSDIIFIDIDDCITNGIIEPWAMEKVEQFNSYTERSQSGNGLHILIRGKKPKKRCRKHGNPYEIYDCLRPCYLTGDVVGARSTIAPEARQEPLYRLFEEIFGNSEDTRQKRKSASGKSRLSDNDVILKATLAKNGNEFKALWDGSTLGHNGDESAADLALMNKLAFWTGGNAAQMERLFSRSGLGQRDKWRNRPDYRERTVQKAISDAREFYEPPEAGHPAQERHRIDEAGISIDFEELTEGGNASRLERIHGRDMRFNHTLKKWLLWDGGRWQQDNNGGAMRKAEDVVGALYIAASSAMDKEERAKITSFAKQTDSRRGLTNLLMIAANRLTFSLTSNAFDCDSWLLGAGDVTVDLKADCTRAPRREDLITRAIGVRFDKSAKCPTWNTFVTKIFDNDHELIRYVQRAVGYCLSGSMAEQVFFFCHGKGSNGKSVFLAILRALLGEYAVQADFSTFLVQRNEKVRNDLAALAGARVITAIEAEEGSRLSMSVIKAWTGGDPITARFLFGEYFTFRPTGKLWLASNDKPVISERNFAAWRRVQLIPFNVTFTAATQDREMEEKLLKELPGILNWALEGLVDYLQSGLQTPKAVQAATDQYRQENDSLRAFIAECCELGKLKACKNSELYTQYINFCKMSGLAVLSQTKFSPELSSHPGVTSRRSKFGIDWTGIALKTDWCRVEDNPTSQAEDAKGVGSSPNAQSTPKSTLREDIAHLTPNPTPHNETNPTPTQKCGENGEIGQKNPGFQKFKAGMAKRRCCLCGRTFPYDLTPYYNNGVSGYICSTCHMHGPPAEPLEADLQTKIRT